MARVTGAAKTVGAGVEWNDSRDIVSGSAGIGCALLWASSALKRPDLLELARRAGDRLLELGKPQGEGLAWSMTKADEPRMMPNFSHGTAGVAYFLSQLGRATKEPKYTDAAKRGAAYLAAETGQEGLIYHHDPGGRNLYYLGWCHGPVGTSRLFASLHVATGDAAAGAWIDRAAQNLLAAGIPEKRSPGYWNNYGLCCGDAGVLRFFLDHYRLDKRPEQIAFAKRLGKFLVEKGEASGEGLKWTFAENRVSPGEVAAQTGLMQGAAGIGLALLWLDGFEQGRPALVRMPDAPWR
jgi:lantibiotic modifying enzyme